MQPQKNRTEPGGTIDSWCGKCKMILAHTIEAMVGVKPARVHCNTCQSQHAYKASEPTKAPARAGGTRPGRYKTLLATSNPTEAKTYSPKDTYRAGDVLQHPMFGVGVTTAVKDISKIEVLFEAGPKLLVHGR
jgi:hypothetical protein